MFSFPTVEYRFPPGEEQSLKFCFHVVKPQFSGFQSLRFIVVKAKSPILSFKICEELSAKQNLEIQQILSLQKSQKVE